MFKYKILALAGKSGAGKDYCLKQIAKANDYHTIVSATTRPKRDYEREGIDYHFLSEQEFKNSNFLEHTEFNGWFYGTRVEDLDPALVNIGVFNPAGVRALSANKNVDLSVIFVDASDKTRLLRQLNREKDPNVKEIIRRFMADEEDFKDFPYDQCRILVNEDEGD